MKRALLLGLALLLGVLAGECLTRNFVFRAQLGRIVRRGELQALVGTRGIYDRDVQSRRRSLPSLIEEAKVNRAAARTPVSASAIDHEMELLRAQLPNEKAWDALLANAGTSARALRREVAENLRSRGWLEAQVAAANPSPNEQDERRYYQAHRAEFQEPQRFRASHLFLAAPVGYPSEVIARKRALIDALAARQKNGEAFPALVAEFSEDEATKTRDGDLNYFAEARMLPEVFASAGKLQPGQTTPQPIRSQLGYHLLRLQEALPPQQIAFETAAPEIATRLDDERRVQVIRAAVASLL
jgi:hypothetical protein